MVYDIQKVTGPGVVLAWFLSSLLLGGEWCCREALGADTQAAVAPASPLPAPQPVAVQGDDDLCWNGGAVGRRGGYCRACCMFPHYAYFPCSHGYYYFHPYNYTMIPLQQATATSWGVDPRNPYSNEIFQTVYAQVEAERAAAGAPAPDPGYAK